MPICGLIVTVFVGSSFIGTRQRHNQALHAGLRSFHITRQAKRGVSNDGTCELVLIDNKLFQVLMFSDAEPGKLVTAKVKDMTTGGVAFKTWKSGTKIQYITGTSRPATYLYFDDICNEFVFMDKETFDEVRVHRDALGEVGVWLREGADVALRMANGKFIDFGFTSDVIEEIIGFTTKNTEEKRNDGSKGHKHCILSNGLTKKGPAFLEIGDRVVIEPTTGQIIRRLK